MCGVKPPSYCMVSWDYSGREGEKCVYVWTDIGCGILGRQRLGEGNLVFELSMWAYWLRKHEREVTFPASWQPSCEAPIEGFGLCIVCGQILVGIGGRVALFCIETCAANAWSQIFRGYYARLLTWPMVLRKWERNGSEAKWWSDRDSGRGQANSMLYVRHVKRETFL